MPESRGRLRHTVAAFRRRWSKAQRTPHRTTARRPELVDIPGATVLALDITDPGSIVAAAAAAQDVTLLVNNAGVDTVTELVTGDLDRIRLELDPHFGGTLGVIRARS